MGIALAEASLARGWPTSLFLGPSPLPPPCGSRLEVARFRSTEELQELLHEHWPAHDLLVMAAAVADYRPAQAPGSKTPPGESPWTLVLEPTPDLVAELAASSRPDQTIIGFALEPAAGLLAGARAKLAAKGLSAIVANPLETMDAERISGVVILRDGRTLAPPAEITAKGEFAVWLLGQVEVIEART